MDISNKTAPKYYAKFRESVINGEFPVCETISMEMNRIDDLIRDPTVYYDPAPVEGWIRFCENELTLTDGSDLHLLDSFKLWGEQVYGWYVFVEKEVYRPNKNGTGGGYVKRVIKKRLINKQYLIVARGAAKSLYGSCIQSYGLTVDTATTYQVTTAPTMKQAEEIISPIRTAITKSKGPLFKFLTEALTMMKVGNFNDHLPKLLSTKKGIENRLTNSLLEVRPMTIAKLQGLRCKYATLDEWLSGDIREDVMTALEQGAAKNLNYLIIAMSSEGTVRNGVGDSVKMELASILKGDYKAQNVSIWWYRLDDIKEVSFPDMWIKANPNLGITVDPETIQQDVERAENAPAARNDIIAKRFGIPMEGFTYFFTYEETKIHRKRTYWNLPCSLGCDLSRGDDFCAFTFLFPLRKDLFGVKTRAYISERTLRMLHPALKEKYKEFVKEGTLQVLGKTTLDMDEIYEDLDLFIERKHYEVLSVGYDPYNAKHFIERWEREHGSFGITKVIQGSRTESVPLGELKKLAEERALLFDELIMSFTMGNCIVLEDTNGNKKLYKRKKDEKIDNVSAMMDAYVSFKENIDLFE